MRKVPLNMSTAKSKIKKRGPCMHWLFDTPQCLDQGVVYSGVLFSFENNILQ
jgi:hypothetical protein